MEKKTIGKFIATLRKANGMTQKELGEKLFVSDKTISRWECDECTPELSLIPTIAEIFGITTDELLRGERNNPERVMANTDSEDYINKQKAKSEKQFRTLLDRSTRKYGNLTLISIGISLLGLILAIVANLGFSKGLIAFCLACIFAVASTICQLCFANNGRIIIEEENDTYLKRIQTANTKVTKTAVRITLANLLLIAFCLPLVTLIDGANFGMVFGTWVGYGLLFTFIALLILSVLYALVIRKLLIKQEWIVLTEKEQHMLPYKNKLLKKTLIIAVSIAIILFIGYLALNALTENATEAIQFDTWQEFKEYVENDYDRWLEEGYSYEDENGNLMIDIEDGVYPNRVEDQYINDKDEVIFEYYYNPMLYHDITFHADANGNLDYITVLTADAYWGTNAMYEANTTGFAILLILDVVIGAGVYFIKSRKYK